MLIEQTKLNGTEKLTTIEIGLMDRVAAEKLSNKLNGRTFMDFETIVAPIGGSCAVSVQTRYDATKDEILGMLIFLMAGGLSES